MSSNQPDLDLTAANRVSDLARPLDLFYAESGLALPPMQRVDGEEVPEPYRRLLVHHNDMTPTLEEFYGSEIVLQVLGRRLKGNEYCREVVLHLKSTGEPVEFGANRILLDRFSPEAQQAILAETSPQGHIMRDYAVIHECRPNAFIRVASDHFINEALRLSGAQILFGRHNRLYDPLGRLISEVVEILRPVASPRS